MDTFVARQPIFDRRLDVFGYELLFRGGIASEVGEGERGPLGDTSPSAATGRVVSAWFFSVGLDRLTRSKRGFINMPRELLVSDFAEILDPKRAILEILEDVKPDEEVIEACLALKQRGFRLALDDYRDLEHQRELADYADIIKVDFVGTDEEQQFAIAGEFNRDKPILLAEKVETREEFQAAEDAGYRLFQGFFFAEPELIRGRRLEVPKAHYLRLIKSINSPEFRFAELAEIVRRDAGLTYKLLRYINSAAFGWRARVTSIGHALMLLGEIEIRRWATLAALGGIAEDRPQELIASCVLRGRMCEQLAGRMNMGARSMDLFFLGMLSRFDVVMGQPMKDVLAGVSLPDDVAETLLDPEVDSRLRALLDLIEGYEEGEWERLSGAAAYLQIDEKSLPAIFIDAVEWSEAIFETHI